MELELTVEEEGSGSREHINVKVEEGSTVKEVLESEGINPETVLVESGGRIVPKGEELEDVDGLRVLQVISGG